MSSTTLLNLCQENLALNIINIIIVKYNKQEYNLYTYTHKGELT